MAISHLENFLEYHRGAAVLSARLGQKVLPEHIQGYEKADEKLHKATLNSSPLVDAHVKKILEKHANTLNSNCSDVVNSAREKKLTARGLLCTLNLRGRQF